MKKLLAFLLALVMMLSVTTAIATAEEAQPKVIVDGVLDDSYPEAWMIDHSWYTFWQNNTVAYTPVDPERVKNTIRFTWDDDFVYIYFTAESKDPLFQPEPGTTKNDVESWQFVEQISLYIDTAPSVEYAATCQNKEITTPCEHFYCNCNDGPAKYYRLQARCEPAFGQNWYNYYRSDEGMFLTKEQFAARRGGEKGYEDLDAMYLTENGACNAVSFIDYETNTYGCEFSYPRKEGEKYFKLNIVNGVGAKEWEDLGPELPYTMSANSAWWMNKDGMFEIWDEFIDGDDNKQEPVAVTTAKRLINDLPEKITLENEAAVTSANNAFGKLSQEEIESWMDAAMVAKLQDAIHCVEVWRVIAKIGDVDGAGEVDATDALIALRNAVGKQDLDEAQFIRADVNADEKIDAGDALDILKYAVKKLDRFAAAQKMEAELYAE